jgi:hypothetical protein
VWKLAAVPPGSSRPRERHIGQTRARRTDLCFVGAYSYSTGKRAGYEVRS